MQLLTYCYTLVCNHAIGNRWGLVQCVNLKRTKNVRFDEKWCVLFQTKYKEDYEKNKGRNFTEIPETNEMVLSKELRPVQSKKLYEEKSKDLLKNVSIGAGLWSRLFDQELQMKSEYS